MSISPLQAQQEPPPLQAPSSIYTAPSATALPAGEGRTVWYVNDLLASVFVSGATTIQVDFSSANVF